nr:MAG TPA: hypothetical protein [Caudoviricetes sp.]
MVGPVPILQQRGGAIAPPLYFNRVEIDPFRKD